MVRRHDVSFRDTDSEISTVKKNVGAKIGAVRVASGGAADAGAPRVPRDPRAPRVTRERAERPAKAGATRAT